MKENTERAEIRHTRSERFVAERKEYWLRLQGLIEKAKSGNYRRLTPEEAREFPNLYRKVCTDSEMAKTLTLSPDTIDYINRLVQFSHNILYSSPRATAGKMLNFFLADFPLAFLRNAGPILFTAALFFGVAILTFGVVLSNPALAENIFSRKTIDMMKEMYSADVSSRRDAASNIFMSGYYINNNISIAFFCFVTGVTFGLGTLVLLVYNAVSIGGIAAVVVSAGHGANFLQFVTAHSAFELLGICVTSGCGLALGLSLVHSTPEKRGAAFSKKALELVPVLITGALFIFCAAFIEGFLSPSALPYPVKAAAALLSLAFIVAFSYKAFIGKSYRKMLVRRKK